MKQISLYTICAFVTAFSAASASQNMYLGAISAQNIGGYQHSIAQNAVHAFTPPIHRIVPGKKTTPSRQNMQPARDLYGKMPEYGTMPTYGEYGDDTGVFGMGRNGGDLTELRISNFWLNANYYDEYMRMNHFNRLNARYGTVMAGITAASTQIGAGTLTWGPFGDYIGGDLKNSELNIKQNSGHIGLYGSYNIWDLNISGILNAGFAKSDADITDYDNTWIAASANAEYNIRLDHSTALTPSIFAGYTLISDSEYTISQNNNIINDKLSLFTVAPGIKMLRNIGHGWYGNIGAKYVFNFSSDGDIKFNNTELQKLTPRDFSEYGIGIEKHFGPSQLNLYLNRRDGGHTGWSGGANIKYIF